MDCLTKEVHGCRTSYFKHVGDDKNNDNYNNNAAAVADNDDNNDDHKITTMLP